ncbi:MAG: hypothetical protein ACHQXL_03310, partial [Candidatus Limnocylindrales bacterium]
MRIAEIADRARGIVGIAFDPADVGVEQANREWLVRVPPERRRQVAGDVPHPVADPVHPGQLGPFAHDRPAR